jgi:hypothetical protein
VEGGGGIHSRHEYICRQARMGTLVGEGIVTAASYRVVIERSVHINIDLFGFGVASCWNTYNCPFFSGFSGGTYPCSWRGSRGLCPCGLSLASEHQHFHTRHHPALAACVARRNA